MASVFWARPMKIAAGTLVLFAAASSAQPPPDRTFVEEVDVSESSVVIELPRLGKVSPEEFEPDDFVVEVNGKRRRVTGVSALDLKANPRPVLVYVDAVLLGVGRHLRQIQFHRGDVDEQRRGRDVFDREGSVERNRFVAQDGLRRASGEA